MGLKGKFWSSGPVLAQLISTGKSGFKAKALDLKIPEMQAHFPNYKAV
jgi:hypothetical protein